MATFVFPASRQEAIVRVEGCFDHRVATECFATLRRAPHLWWKKLTVIMAGVETLDLQGIESLLALREFTGGEAELWLSGCGPAVGRMLEVAGLRRCFVIRDVPPFAHEPPEIQPRPAGSGASCPRRMAEAGAPFP